MNKAKTIMLTAGGTGGHIFPAQSLARELVKRGYQLVVITDKRGAAFDDKNTNIKTHYVRAGTPFARGSFLGFKKIINMGLLAIGVLQAMLYIRKYRPACVVGFGGYPSVPTMLAASLLSAPTIIHEQNAVLGRANRFLAPRMRAIATSFHHVDLVRAADKQKITFTGTPVRPDIINIAQSPYAPPFENLNLFIMGGSQGTRAFSQIIPEAIKLLPESTRKKIIITQQCRPEDINQVRQTYADMQMENVTLESFFTNVPEILTLTHLLICRAGASTLAEITTAGRPAILVPLPSAIDDHQTANARALDSTGAGWLMPEPGFTPQALATKLETFLTLPEKLTIAARKARDIGHQNATAHLADLVESHTNHLYDKRQEGKAA